MQLPQPTGRYKVNVDALELRPLLNEFYATQVAIDAFIGPYNARQRDSENEYVSPSIELLSEFIAPGRMGAEMHQIILRAVNSFCIETQGTIALAAPHPTTLHSIQLPKDFFEIKSKGRHLELLIAGIETPILLENTKNTKSVKFVIIRPKLNSLGTASMSNWEVLLFDKDYGFIPNWVDSQLNPRFSGCL